MHYVKIVGTALLKSITCPPASSAPVGGLKSIKQGNPRVSAFEGVVHFEHSDGQLDKVTLMKRDLES